MRGSGLRRPLLPCEGTGHACAQTRLLSLYDEGYRSPTAEPQTIFRRKPASFKYPRSCSTLYSFLEYSDAQPATHARLVCVCRKIRLHHLHPHAFNSVWAKVALASARKNSYWHFFANSFRYSPPSVRWRPLYARRAQDWAFEFDAQLPYHDSSNQSRTSPNLSRHAPLTLNAGSRPAPVSRARR